MNMITPQDMADMMHTLKLILTLGIGAFGVIFLAMAYARYRSIR